MKKLSRWVGVVEVVAGPYEDDTPILYDEDDPFVVRFRVRPVAWLPRGKTIPIYEDRVWDTLTFTREHDRGTSTWTGRIRASLGQLDQEDGAFLESLILEQASDGQVFDVDDKEYQRHLTHRVRRLDGVVSVSVPEEEKEEPEAAARGGDPSTTSAHSAMGMPPFDTNSSAHNPPEEGVPTVYRSGPYRFLLLQP